MIKVSRTEKCRAFIYSHIGENHVLSGQDNQDIIAFEQLEKAWYMVIADGVSMAAHAKEGAQAAVDVTRMLFEKLVSDKQLFKDSDYIKVELVRSWKGMFESGWNDYAATLNFAIYADHTLLLGQIGDGLIAADIGKTPVILSEWEDFYSTETYALAERVKRSSIKIKVFDDIHKVGLYMSSDGIGKELQESLRIELIDYLGNMMAKDDRSIEEELDLWVRELERRNGDDKSIGFVEWEE